MGREGLDWEGFFDWLWCSEFWSYCGVGWELWLFISWMGDGFWDCDGDLGGEVEVGGGK